MTSQSDDRTTDGDNRNGIEIIVGDLAEFNALEQVIAAVEDGVLVLDEQGVVVLANGAARRMFERNDDDLVGQEFGYPVPIGRAADIDLLGAGGVRSVEMRAAVTAVEGRPFRVATFRDVTERVRADRQLREAIRTREELLASAAHELKTPVTVIAGMSVTLRDEWDSLDDATRRSLIDRVAARGEQLQDLVHEVMTRRATDDWSSSPAVERARSLVLRAIDPWPDLEVVTVVDDQTLVWADGGQVVEILSNLVDNARKYGAPPVHIEVSTNGPWTEIRVRDHGPGVPVEHRASVFETGWRGDDVRDTQPGSGLGLGIVRKLVVANEGVIWYEDIADGACFVVRLPAGPPVR